MLLIGARDSVVFKGTGCTGWWRRTPFIPALGASQVDLFELEASWSRE